MYGKDLFFLLISVLMEWKVLKATSNNLVKSLF